MLKIGIACFGVIGLSLLLLSCDNGSSQQVFDDYQYRMGNVLNISIHEAASSKLSTNFKLVSYPSRRSLLQSRSRTSINVLEFWKLRQCRLQTLLGEKNNSLGKVMPVSQEWIYTAKFLALAPLCVKQLKNQKSDEVLSDATLALIASLQSSIAIKQREKYRYAWNATLASDEFIHTLSLATPAVSFNSDGAANLEAAWERLLALLTQYEHSEAVPENIESVLKIMASSRYMGALLQSLRLIHSGLLPVTEAIKERSRDCRLNSREKIAIKNVFSKYYIGMIQPYLAKINKKSITYRRLLLELIQPFFESDRHISQSALDQVKQYYFSNWQMVDDRIYQQSTNSELEKMQESVLNHALAWKAFSKNCQLEILPNAH